MSVPAPYSTDCQDLQFKALCRLRVFNGQPGLFSSSTNLVAAAPLYGLIFVGHPNGFQVIPSKRVGELHATTRGEISEYPRREITLNCMPSHLSVSCDQTLLAVSIMKDGSPSVVIYNVASFGSKNVSIVSTIRLATSPGNRVLDLQFNPGIPQFLAACTSDGGVGVFELKGKDFVLNTLPPATHATSLCWSPKGKQLVIGDSRGNILQLKPDLKLVKSYPPPPDKPTSTIVNLLWISNYQFAAVYANTANPSERPCIMIVNVPKGAATSYINFEDICFSSGELRPPQYYMVLQAKWNLIMVGSANSGEVGVLAMQQDQVSWQQWTQEDAARAELPLSQDKQDTYPIGLAIDTSSTQQLPWGENQSLHPMPMLHILSHQGLLCVFHVINILPGAVCICEAPQPLPDTSGLDQFVMKSQPSQTPQDAQPPQPSQPPQTMQPPQSSLPSQFQQPSQQGQHQQSPQHTTPPFQAAPAKAVQPQLIPAASSTPLKQLSSMTNQFQPMPQTSKPLAMNMSGVGLIQPQPSFAMSSSAAPTSVASSFSFAQTTAAGGISGFGAKTTTSAFSASSLQSLTTPAPPPSYTTTTTSQQTILPEASQRPSTLVPVPAVQNSTTTTSHVQETEPSTGAGENLEEKDEVVDPAIYVEHIQEEIRVFENELKKLKHSVTQKLPPVGTEEEKKTLFKKTEELKSNFAELSKSTADLKHDVNDLKTIGLESAMWAEDARSRLRQFNNASYLKLVKAQELDPVSARLMSNIQQMFYYVENQLSNVSKQLNVEWSQYQDSRSRNDLFVPTMDGIFQTMVKQNGILNRLRITLDDISQRIAKQKLRNSNRIHLISESALAPKPASGRLQHLDGGNSIKLETDLSSLAESLLETKLKKHQTDDSDLEALACRALNLNLKKLPADLVSQKQLGSKKEEKLRELLSQIPMARIKVDRTPSEMSLVGQRPCVSFSSSVLAISPRKQTLTKEKKMSESPSSPLPKASASAPLPSPSHQSTAAVTASGFGEISQSSKPPAAGLRIQPPASPSVQSKTNPVKIESQPLFTATGAFSAAPNVSIGQSLNKTTAIKPSVSSKSEASSPGFSSSFNFSLPTSSSSPSISGKPTTPSETKPTFPTLAKGGAGTSSILTSQTTPFVQPKSVLNQTSIFAAPPTPAATPEVTKPPLFVASPKSSDSLSALSDMVSKAGVSSAASPKGFGEVKPTSSVSAQPGTSTISFSSFAKPSAAPVAVPASQSTAPITILEVSPKTPTSASKQGLLPTPSISSGGTLFGGALTITPIPSSVSSTVPANSASPSASSVAAVADSTTSFFGGMGLGSTPTSTSKPTASIFGGTGGGFQIGKTSSLFGSPSTTDKPTAPAVTTTSAPIVSSFTKVATPPLSSSTSFFGSAPATSTPTPAFGLGSLASSLATQTSTSSGSAVDSTPQGVAPEAAKSPSAASAVPAPAPVPTPAPAPAAAPTPAPAPASPLPATGSILAVTTSSAPSSTNLTQSLFGTTTTSSSLVKPLFGQASAPSSATPAFGQTPASTNATPLFGQAAASSSATPAFGQSQTVTTTGTSLFGAAASSASSASSFTFALPSISSPTTGGAAATPKPFSFAVPAATAATTAQPAFGSNVSSPFTSPVTTTTASASFFGQAICSPSSTGQATGSLFGGGTSAVSSAGFASPTTSSQPLFGQTSAFGAKPAFGQSGGALFGSGPSSGSGFASPTSTSIFGGGSPSTTSLFGGGASSPPSSNLFQAAASGTGNVFGQTASSPSSGSFSSGMGGTIGQTGFGTASSFQARPSGGFGAFQSPSSGFGAPPAFGSPTAFGGAPSFGGAPAFGSPNRVFGAAAPSPGFGSTSPTQSNSTFEALATQDSGVTFGNLAQGGPQSPPSSNLFGGSTPSATPFSGNTGSSFGGSSFSSWR